MRRTITAVLLATFVSVAAYPAPASAGPKKMKADICTAKGKLVAAEDGWRVEITYKIELKYFPPDEHTELVFFIKEDDHALRDVKGRPVRIVVPLEHPYKC